MIQLFQMSIALPIELLLRSILGEVKFPENWNKDNILISEKRYELFHKRQVFQEFSLQEKL